MQFCDLHMHSTESDGTDQPGNLARLARDAGLSAFALTDHDTTAGLAACAAGAEAEKLDFVPGIELSADPGSVWGGQAGEGVSRGTLHLLGYFIAYEGEAAAGLRRIEQRLVEARAQRNPEMVDKLRKLGVMIRYEQVEAEAGGGIIGRPHIAKVMMKQGYVKSIHEAFARYLGRGGAGYVRKDQLSAAEAIETIHQAGGLVCLAHPVQLGLGSMDAIEHMVAKLKEIGLDGIETRHSDHTRAQIEAFDRMAEKYGLVTSGGSDYHGANKAIELGAMGVERAVYERLRAQWERSG